MRKQRMWPVIVTIWVTFFVYGVVAAPVPGVNEPHYLCKAKHFWQPDWCEQDFFLASPNAHLVFYSTVGYLTNFMSLPFAAWIGRAIASLVLAWGWTRCFSQLLLTTSGPVWCAWVFLALTSCGNFSGEWIVGGVEGKVFTYGLLLAAFGDVLRRRPALAAVWAGLAVSFHPVVGVWGLLAFAASCVARFKPRRNDHRTMSAKMIDRCIRAIQPSLIIALLGLPGLIPVIQLLLESVSPATRLDATYIQVYFRLAHHLDPMQFPRRAYLSYAVLLTIWLVSLKWGGRTNSKKGFDRIVFWAVLFALAGIAIGWGPRPAMTMPYYKVRMHLLKFYPFRLADVLIPIAVATSLMGVLERTLLHPADSIRRRPLIPLSVFGMLVVLCASLWHAHSLSETNRYSREDRADWLDICEWIDRHLPTDAVVQSPPNGWAFKWFAHRAEYVSFKDCPQNAAGIVEWNRRLNFLQRWYQEKYSDEFYSTAELAELGQQTGITHLLTDRLGPLELEPIYRNGTFQVYDLSSANR